MKTFLRSTTACLCLILGTTAYLLSQTEEANHQAPVTITWRVQLDHSQGFDFSTLGALILYRQAKGRAWVSLPPVTADGTGAFTSTVPAGNWVSLEVDTSDPTIRDTTDRTDPFPSYQ